MKGREEGKERGGGGTKQESKIKKSKRREKRSKQGRNRKIPFRIAADNRILRR